MQKLLSQIKGCTVCAAHLPFSPSPILQASAQAKIVIIGQAPGRKAHEKATPWDDASGNELRRWLGVTREAFYNPRYFALVPMGFCFPGTGKNGDLPPRPECAPLWHQPLMQKMKSAKLILLIGHYAQRYYLKEQYNESLTENVRRFKLFLPRYLPLVHPSPRNKPWQKRNPWFEKDLVPELQEIVKGTLI